jgi:hypothetical protein
MINIAWGGNDKAIIVVILGYPILTIFNLTAWLILRILKKHAFKIYMYMTIGLALLYIPALILASQF